MLRRRLLLNLVPLVVLLLAMAIAAIWLLQDVLRDLKHIDNEAWVVVEQVNELSIAINTIELDLYHLRLGQQRYLDRLIEDVEVVARLVGTLEGSYVIREAAAQPHYQAIMARLPEFQRQVGALATSGDADLSRRHMEAALSAAVALRHDTLPLSRFARDHAHAEQEALSNWFRWLVLGLALVFLVVINVSVLVLLRMTGMILRPVEKLLAGTVALAEEKFDSRIELDEQDEFGQLAQAYNLLAQRLAANEQRKMEVLLQVSIALSHELNNASAIIELQLQLLSRRTGGNPALVNCLRQIHDGLERMTQTVRSLASVRRIVLTEYVPGMKMLDLERSTAVEESGELAPARAES